MSTSMLNVRISHITCASQDLTPSRRYRLKLSPKTAFGIQTPKSAQSKCASNKVSWDRPFGDQFSLSSRSGGGPSIAVTLFRVRCLSRLKTIHTWVLDISSIEEEKGARLLSIPSKSDYFSGTLEMQIQVSRNDALADAVHAEESLVKMKDGPKITAPFPGYGALANSIIDETNAWQVLIDRLDRLDGVVKALDSLAQIHPWVSLAWGVVSVAFKVVKAQSDRDQSVSRLVVVMAKSCDVVCEAGDLKERSERHKTIITQILQQVVQCAYFVRDYSKERSFRTRTLKYAISNIDGQIEEYKSSLAALCENLLQFSTVQTNVKVYRLLDLAEEAKEQIAKVQSTVDASLALQLLGEMQYSTNARPDLEDVCLPGTRHEALDSIVRWVCGFDHADLGSSNEDEHRTPLQGYEWATLRSSDSSRVLWVCGDEGSGKTAIVQTVAAHFSQLKRLGSIYAFNQSRPAETNPSNVFSTIARDIADLDLLRRDRLLEVIGNNTSVRRTTSCKTQFNYFIVAPSTDLPSIGEILIVIDAVDETDEAGRAELITLLTTHAHKIPSSLRILVTSRFEPDVRDALQYPLAGVDVLLMDNIPEGLTSRDISQYCKDKLQGVARRPSGEPQPGFDDGVRNLTMKANRSFQWAATACQSIAYSNDPWKQMDAVLNASDGLDGLYSSILKQQLDLLDGQPENQALLRSLLNHVACVQEPLSLRTLAGLTSKPGKVNSEDELAAQQDIAGRLAAVLNGTDSVDSPITPRHSSFRDFLRDKNRSGPFHVDSVESNRSLALSCLQAMEDGLKFNICNVATSFKRNPDIRGLDKVVDANVRPSLLYASRYWTYHVSRLPTPDESVTDAVTEFLLNRFLQWLEVMSATKSPFQDALTLLRDTMISSPKLRLLIRDASRFASVFAVPIITSVPHIYLSALAFAPMSPMFERYQALSPRSVILTQGRLSEWPSLISIMEGHARQVNSAAFSPDGSKIVSGSADGTLRIWDAKTGEKIGDPLKGHDGPVMAVAFSPDGLQIISGSQDHTLRRWNAGTGDRIGAPIRGHEGYVTYVTFSVDGGEIVSASTDATIRFWNAANGAYRRQLTEHGDAVTCVSFSPDGLRMLSCSNDCTIRIWDTATLASVGTPLQGHTGYVLSAVFSPDGGQIISGSYDGTVRRWDTTTGAYVGEPLIGHTGPVASVAFSPDGNKVISGSWDSTIRTWEAGTGASMGHPLRGHTQGVAAIAVSPDGSFILSGSHDNTLRLWDSMALHDVDENSKSHTQSITSLAFFPGGSKLVSGSDDCTVRLWDLDRGVMIDGPLRGHKGPINCVDISPDGRWIVSGSDDKTLRMWDAETGNHIGNPIQSQTKITSIAFSRDGCQMASGLYDGTVRFWNVATRTSIGVRLKAHNTWVHSVSYSPNNTRVATASLEHAIRLWDVATGENVMNFVNPSQGHNALVACMAFSPDGMRILSGSWDNTLRLWDIASGNPVGPPLRGHSKAIAAVAFSHDGKRVASGSNDKSARLWDVDSGKEIGEPAKGHTGLITSIAFSPDGKSIATASRDKSLRLWNLDWETSISESQYPKNLFPNRTFALRDGWILGPEEELILWIPPVHRVGLCYPHNQCIGSRYITELNFSKFKYGSDWVECRT